MLRPGFNALVALIALGVEFRAPAQDYTAWSDYGGSADSSQYSALSQIDRANVSQLKVAWTYPTRDASKYSFNPLVVDGSIYVLARNNSIVALDAATGREIWAHPADPGTTIITNRGMNYWESKDRSDRRLLYASNHFLHAIDARTGRLIPTFGKAGSVDLKTGLDRDPGGHQAGPVHHAGTRVRGSADPGVGDESGLWFGSRGYPRLRRAHGQTGLDISHHSTAR